MSFSILQFEPGQERKATFWAQNEGRRCWYCTHVWEGVVYSLPIRKGKVPCSWIVEGVYCSLNCVKAAVINQGGVMSTRAYAYFTTMAREVYDVTSTITAAPPLELLEGYSINQGMTIDEFRTCGVIGISNYSSISESRQHSPKRTKRPTSGLRHHYG